ncbi:MULTISPECIES: MBL fold metallo-hydrolase [unclassified Providencia]|uniref:MBL fold metallo-hydrolase n=1 Tax=unclassified Providencia TaxID=2633465 RepID=UPI000E99BB85|nr:MBL fold metallo-hydrolase [Providencia sp.]MBP6081834.1 ribonuclease Z [Providencia sp.]HBO23535.1 ribonuclease Z [Providencia sp.]
MLPNFQLTVIGNGDAYDSQRTNASILVQENGYQLLVDCGPTVPSQLFSQIQVDDLDVIYITHCHPDHCLGLTSLLNWMDSYRRKRPLIIIAQQAQWVILEPLIAFSHWPQARLGFDIIRQDSEQLQKIGPWQAMTAMTQHSVRNLSLHLISQSGDRLFYSGDGQISSEGEQLALQSDWVFIECETLESHYSHGSWHSIQHLLQKNQLSKSDCQWRLYHIDPNYRQELSQLIRPYDFIQLAERGEQLIAPIRSLKIKSI